MGDFARLFWSGRSQAVRLPKAYRIDAQQVRIWREGNRVVLEPINESIDENGWPESFWEVFGQVDESLDLGDRSKPAEEREELFDE